MSEAEIDSLAWIHVRDRRLLSVRTEGKAKFYLPGGKREPGEGDVAGLCREIREELGVELDPRTNYRAEYGRYATLFARADSGRWRMDRFLGFADSTRRDSASR